MVLYTHTIEAHNDFEFGSTHQRTLDYSIAIPDEGKIKGLVVYVPGFGEDAGTYRKNFQEFVCKKYNMACLLTDYHGLFSRPNNGATIRIEAECLKLLRSITGLTYHENIDDIVKKAAEMKADPDTPLLVPANLYPGNNEYQNFGILPALDNIFAINNVFNKYPQILKKTYAIGSSYGGYIANLISKLAPSTLNAVFDNSSWATPNLAYIHGQELDQPEFVANLTPKVTMLLNVVTPWTHKTFMPNHFNEDRQSMRSFPDNHLNIMAQAGSNKTVYRCVHAQHDPIANTEEKINLLNTFKKKGFDVELQTYGTANIDGRYIKNMDHGMGLSMRVFFAKSLESTGQNITDDNRIDFDFKHTLTFPCHSQSYTVNYDGDAQPQCTLTPLH